MKKLFYLVTLVFVLSSCTMVDNSEVGIKFKKFSVTDQGNIEANPVTGLVMYNPFTINVSRKPTYFSRGMN